MEYSLRVWIVEDDGPTRLAISKLIRQAGAEVVFSDDDLTRVRISSRLELVSEVIGAAHHRHSQLQPALRDLPRYEQGNRELESQLEINRHLNAEVQRSRPSSAARKGQRVVA